MRSTAVHTMSSLSGRRILGFVLLILFVGSYLGMHVSHEYHHAMEHSHVHTEDAEADGCHRAIYHGDIGSCDHDTHILAARHGCQLCHIWIHQQYDTTEPVAIISDRRSMCTHPTISYRGEFIQDIHIHSSSSRGPPV